MLAQRHGVEVAVIDRLPARRIEGGVEAGAGQRRVADHRRNAARLKPLYPRRKAIGGMVAIIRVEALQGIGALGIAASRTAHPGAVPFHLDARPGLEPRPFDGKRIGQRHVSSDNRH
ncbi:hypothetical protein D3C72_1948190 [compost metagenome]